MRTTQTAPTTTFGRDLGEAEQALRRVHRDLLSRGHTTFEAWVVMTLLSSQGPIEQSTLRGDLATRLEIDPGVATGLLDQLQRDGLIQIEPGPGQGQPRFDLTAAGRTKFQALTETVSRTTAKLLGGITPEDIETTRRTLRTARERALALHAR